MNNGKYRNADDINGLLFFIIVKSLLLSVCRKWWMPVDYELSTYKLNFVWLQTPIIVCVCVFDFYRLSFTAFQCVNSESFQSTTTWLRTKAPWLIHWVMVLCIYDSYEWIIVMEWFDDEKKKRFFFFISISKYHSEFKASSIAA